MFSKKTYKHSAKYSFSLQWVLRDKIMMVSGHKNEVVNQRYFKGRVEEMLVQFIQV